MISTTIDICYYSLHWSALTYITFLHYYESDLFILRLLHTRSLPQYKQDLNLSLKKGKKGRRKIKTNQKTKHSNVNRNMAHPTLHPIMCNVPPISYLSLELDKSLIVKIFSYLRLSELVVTSRICTYFHSCYRSLWTDK